MQPVSAKSSQNYTLFIGISGGIVGFIILLVIILYVLKKKQPSDKAQIEPGVIPESEKADETIKIEDLSQADETIKIEDLSQLD